MKYYHNMPCTMGTNYAGQSGYRAVGGVNPVMNSVRRAIDSEFPLAMAYVPWQRWCETYPMDVALSRGTLFPELYLPYTGCQRRNCHG